VSLLSFEKQFPENFPGNFPSEISSKNEEKASKLRSQIEYVIAFLAVDEKNFACLKICAGPLCLCVPSMVTSCFCEKIDQKYSQTKNSQILSILETF
jgi:hypothetical protein